ATRKRSKRRRTMNWKRKAHEPRKRRAPLHRRSSPCPCPRTAKTGLRSFRHNPPPANLTSRPGATSMKNNINVRIQQTDGHADLKIPVERLEAIGQEVAETGIEEWGIEDETPRTVILEYQWGEIGTNIMVRRLSAAQFHV